MSELAQIDRAKPAIGADCRIGGRILPVAVSNLRSDGCAIETSGEAIEPSDFLHLRIAGAMDVNGRIVHCDGRRAQVRFFGLIHPAAIERLA